MASAGVPVKDWAKYEGRCRELKVTDREVVPRDSGGEYCLMDACTIALHKWVACVAEWRSLKATFARSGRLESSLNCVTKLIRNWGRPLRLP